MPDTIVRTKSSKPGCTGTATSIWIALVAIGALTSPAAFGQTSAAAATCPSGQDVRQSGIKPNDPQSAAANTAALRSLLFPGKPGKRTIVFPNPSGKETYYFDDVVPMADGTHLDLCGSTVSFAKTQSVPDDNYTGFIYAVRDFTLENGRVTVSYQGTGGPSRGSAIRLGNRKSDGKHFRNSWDAQMPVPQGNIALRNLQITSNNPAAAVVLLTGGLDSVTIEHVKIDGQRAAPFGFYYEFGLATNAPVANQRQSSHARNMTFRDIEVRNLATPGGKSAGIALVGAQNADVDDLRVDGADFAFFFMPGEALFYRAWLPQGAAAAPRRITLRNINGRNLTTGGAELTGAQVNAHGYLKDLKLSPREQTDLMSFALDGFSFEGARGYGVRASGPVEIRNGRIQGSRNGIILTDECTRFDIDKVTVLDSGGVGIRANFGVALWNPPRKKSGTIRNSFIAGSKDSPAIAIDQSDKVMIEGNRLGYRRSRDASDEAVQRAGIVVGAAGNGVVARANDVATSANAPAYVLMGKDSRGNTVEDPRGASRVSGPWVRSDTSTRKGLKRPPASSD